MIQFANNRKSNGADQLETAGQSIIQLLHKAAGAAEANTRQTVQTAQKIADQLRAAQERIVQLDVEADAYREKSERAA